LCPGFLRGLLTWLRGCARAIAAPTPCYASARGLLREPGEDDRRRVRLALPRSSDTDALLSEGCAAAEGGEDDDDDDDDEEEEIMGYGDKKEWGAGRGFRAGGGAFGGDEGEVGGDGGGGLELRAFHQRRPRQAGGKAGGAANNPLHRDGDSGAWAAEAKSSSFDSGGGGGSGGGGAREWERGGGAWVTAEGGSSGSSSSDDSVADLLGLSQDKGAALAQL